MQNQLNDLKKQANCLLKQISDVYLINKKYFIKAEEILPNLRMFLTPVLEHRDALDHLMRAFSDIHTEGYSIENDLIIYEKRIKNIEKALGHELRSFFDIADFICINMRVYFKDLYKQTKRKKLLAVWEEVEKQEQQLVDISEKIASIRLSRGESYESVNQYAEVIDDLFSMYCNFEKNIRPKLK